jgi:hypothetical protein
VVHADPLTVLAATQLTDRVPGAGVEPGPEAAARRVEGPNTPPDAEQDFLAEVFRVGRLESEVATPPAEYQTSIKGDELLPAESLAEGPDQRRASQGRLLARHRLNPYTEKTEAVLYDKIRAEEALL